MRSILDQIQLKYQSFSKAEKKIADYIKNHKTTLLNIHIQHLAEEIDVSVATITRFCKKVGASGFVEFKILLRDAIEQTETNDETVFSVDSIYHTVIKATNSLINIKDYELACQWIREMEKIHIYGLGSSGLSGKELKIRLSRMGLIADIYTNSHDMIINSSTVGPNDLIIAISSSGQTEDIIDGVQLAKRKKAKVISITNYAETTLTKSSDLVLYTSSVSSFHDNGFINSQLSILYALDIISSLLLKDKDMFHHYQKTLNALNEYRKI